MLQYWYYLYCNIYNTGNTSIVNITILVIPVSRPAASYYPNITLNTGAISLATSLRILVGSKSGPPAFDGFKSESNFSIPLEISLEVNSRSDMGVSGLPSMLGKFPVGSLVKTDVYWLFRASAFSVGSLNTISLEMPVPSQGHYGFHSFPVVD